MRTLPRKRISVCLTILLTTLTFASCTMFLVYDINLDPTATAEVPEIVDIIVILFIVIITLLLCLHDFYLNHSRGVLKQLE